jgi:hypothetical protein
MSHLIPTLARGPATAASISDVQMAHGPWNSFRIAVHDETFDTGMMHELLYVVGQRGSFSHLARAPRLLDCTFVVRHVDHASHIHRATADQEKKCGCTQ